MEIQHVHRTCLCATKSVTVHYCYQVISQRVNAEWLYLPTGLESVDGTTVLGKPDSELAIHWMETIEQ